MLSRVQLFCDLVDCSLLGSSVHRIFQARVLEWVAIAFSAKRHRVPYRINPRRNTPRHILIKLTKTKHKHRILKAARDKQQVTYKENPIGLTG